MLQRRRSSPRLSLKNYDIQVSFPSSDDGVHGSVLRFVHRCRYRVLLHSESVPSFSIHRIHIRWIRATQGSLLSSSTSSTSSYSSRENIRAFFRGDPSDCSGRSGIGSWLLCRPSDAYVSDVSPPLFFLRDNICSHRTSPLFPHPSTVGLKSA